MTTPDLTTSPLGGPSEAKPPLGGPSEAKPPVLHDFTEPAVTSYGKPPAAPDFRADPGEEPEHAASRQKAFDAAFEWHGIPLHPYSSSRESLFSQHRLSMGAPALQSCMEDMDAFAADAHRILWLCSHTPRDWSILRVDPAALQCAIDTWADQHIPLRESLAASTLALEIYFAARANQHEAAPAGKGHGDDAGN